MDKLMVKVVDIAYRAVDEVGESQVQEDWTPYFREIASENFLSNHELSNGNLLFDVGGDSPYTTTLTKDLVMAAMQATVESNLLAMKIRHGFSKDAAYKAVNEFYASFNRHMNDMIKIGIKTYLSKGIGQNEKIH